MVSLLIITCVAPDTRSCVFGGKGTVNTNENPADLFTKMLVVGKREHFVRMLLHHIFRT
jgi:hypothetical protein